MKSLSLLAGRTVAKFHDLISDKLNNNISMLASFKNGIQYVGPRLLKNKH